MTKKKKEKTAKQPETNEAPADAKEDIKEEPTEIDKLLAEVENLKAEVAKANDESLRDKAELENTRKRLQKQKTDELKYASIHLIRELLTVMDNLELALKYAGEDDPLREGVGMALDGMKKVLEQHNLKPIKARGKIFNPSLHEALATSTDLSAENDVVLEEHRTGYMLHDRMVRASGVIVNRLPEKDDSKNGEEKGTKIEIKA